VRRKSCKQCGSDLPIRQFYRHPHYADGHENICKRCKVANVEANRELKYQYYRAQKRVWAARPENIAKRRAYAKTVRGRQVHRASNRRYREFLRLEGQA
jgi:hypothetical protein